MAEQEETEYRNKEAFCLMTYRCEDCGKTERVWNSRDGVAPYQIACRYCGKEARHIEWRHDQRKPEHVPEAGDRVFVSMPRSIATMLVAMRISHSAQTGALKAESDEEIAEVRQRMLRHIYGGGKAPWLITIQEF